MSSAMLPPKDGKPLRAEQAELLRGLRAKRAGDRGKAIGLPGEMLHLRMHHPPADFRERVWSRIDTHEQQAGARRRFAISWPSVFNRRTLAWAGAALLVIVLAPIVVPGHGPIGGEEEVRELQGYLRACVAAEGDPTRLESGPWDTWVARDHDAVNVERAAMLAEGIDEIPRSLLQRLGL